MKNSITKSSYRSLYKNLSWHKKWHEKSTSPLDLHKALLAPDVMTQDTTKANETETIWQMTEQIINASIKIGRDSKDMRQFTN